MGITTVSSREFNQDVSRVKRAAVNGPVFITDRGHLSHVLLTRNTEDFVRTGVELLNPWEFKACHLSRDI